MGWPPDKTLQRYVKMSLLICFGFHSRYSELKCHKKMHVILFVSFTLIIIYLNFRLISRNYAALCVKKVQTWFKEKTVCITVKIYFFLVSSLSVILFNAFSYFNKKIGF